MCTTASKCNYERHKPEETNLYKVVSQNWLSFLRDRQGEGRTVPRIVIKEFEKYLRCGILAHGFGRLQCNQCHTDRLVAFSCKGRGWCPSCGARKMAETAALLVDSRIPLVPTRQFVVTFPMQLRLWLAKSKSLAAWVSAKVVSCLNAHLREESCVENGRTGCVAFIQRFGSAANLNVHLHIIALDGCYEEKSTGDLKFYNADAPWENSLLTLTQNISLMINIYLIKKGYLEVLDDISFVGNTDSLFESDEDLHLPSQAASVSHQIAFGERAGQPVRRLKSQASLWPSETRYEIKSDGCVSLGGYSVHAATAVKAHERERLEKLVRYMSRPALADERISIISENEIQLRLKTPWKYCTHSLMLSPSELIEKLVALVPQPRFHLTRYYGVLAPGSKDRDKLPDMPNETEAEAESGKKSSKGRNRILWAALLKRTYKIDVFQCPNCAGRMQLISVVECTQVAFETLTAMRISPRAPPILPARDSKYLFSEYSEAFSEFGI